MTSVHKRHPEFQADQRQFFDELISETWDSYHSEDWDASRRLEIDLLFKIIQPRRILDIGCGCGFHDAEMAKYPFVELVHGVDYSEKSIEKANRHYPHPKVKRWSDDFLNFPTTAEYDLVVSYQVFEHLYNPDDYLEKCHELIGDGGAIAISTPNWNRLDNIVRRLRGMEPTLLDPQHYREYTPRSLRRLAESHGLRLKGWFGYDITSLMLPRLNKLSYETRLQWGRRLPHVARIICLIFVK